jgi:hypothetical protein|tara:strand:+ start:247 stop:621 length:375 start_codon:yes stop_codon:yes gene_type:complete
MTTSTTVSHTNAFNNVAAADLDVSRLTELYSKVRTTQKSCKEFDSNLTKLNKDRAEMVSQLQVTLTSDDISGMVKIGAKINEIDKKLKDGPSAKIEAFDRAVNEFSEYLNTLSPSLKIVSTKAA